MGSRMHTIRIVRAPAGEAPLWVRESWIGIELPLVGGRQPRVGQGVGALTGPKTFWKQTLFHRADERSRVLRHLADRAENFAAGNTRALAGMGPGTASAGRPPAVTTTSRSG
jgi:hypothetical protein